MTIPGLDWRRLRDRLLTSPAFQRWAAAFPLTRPVARREAAELFRITTGFVYTQVLTACVRLKLFDALVDGPRTVAALAERSGLPAESMSRLLRAAVALRLLEDRGATGYALGRLGAAVIANPGIAAMVEHHALLYEDLRDPLAVLRERGQGQLARYWAYSGNDAAGRLPPERVAEYTRLMSASQSLVAHEILDAYDFARHRRLLDVGGGNGTFASVVATRVPTLGLGLFDLPAVVDHAEQRLAGLGLGSRVALHRGNFFVDRLPDGYDLISLVRVLHDHDDGDALELLRNARRSLGSGGKVLIAEPISGVPGAEASGDAYFGFYLLAMGRGRPRTAGEIEGLLRAAGFPRIHWRRTHIPLLVRVVIAAVD